MRLPSVALAPLLFASLAYSCALWHDDTFWMAWYGWLLALVLYDFCYYWLHRLGHESAILWAAFHSLWAGAIAASLNLNVLPKDYVAEVQVHLGGPFEIDVATLEEEREQQNGGGTAVQTWAPPKAALVMPATYPDEFEVRVFDMSAGPTLVAAIELVSPGNKDREETRLAFAAKCAPYLQAGVALSNAATSGSKTLTK